MLKTQKAQIISVQSLRIITSSRLSSSDNSSDNNPKFNKSTITKAEGKPQSRTNDNVNVENVLNNVMDARRSDYNINHAVRGKTSNIRRDKTQNFEEKLFEAAEKVDQYYKSRGGTKAPSIARDLQRLYIKSQRQREHVKNNLREPKRITEQQWPIQENTKQFQDGHDNSQPEPSFKSKTHKFQDTAKQAKPKRRSYLYDLLKKYEDEHRTHKPIKSMKDTHVHHQVVNIYKSLYDETSKHKPMFKYQEEPSEVIQLKTWNILEKDALKEAIKLGPSNIFEEMILWTSQGKLWRFPIDNEQGLKTEQNVHFSEHVFMERHLQGWCPNSGPIRHFMELVCVGLSKNPYMTVEEKVEHIMWYKNYFAEKQSLLDLGIAQLPPDEAKVKA